MAKSEGANAYQSNHLSSQTSLQVPFHGSSCHIAGSHLIINGKLLQKTEDSADYAERPLPDGGYAWVILASAFILQIISGGILLGVGVFIVEFIESFESSPATVAWIGSINAGFTFLAGICQLFTLTKTIDTTSYPCVV